MKCDAHGGRKMGSRGQAGFTLVELVVSMGLVLAVLGVLLSMQGSALHGSAQAQTDAARLGVMTDVSGYMGDRIKDAALVPDHLTVDGQACDRVPVGLGAALPCLSLVVPHLDAAAHIDRWELISFQYVDPAVTPSDQPQLPALYGVSVALREVRTDGVCGASDPTMVTLASCFSGPTTDVWISSDLALPPAGALAFGYDETSHVVTLQMRSVGLLNGVVSFLPPSGAYSLRGFARNVPPS